MASVDPIQVQKYLKGASYPASKQDLLACAKEHKADDDTYAMLQQLPEQEFEAPTDVSKALGDLK